MLTETSVSQPNATLGADIFGRSILPAVYFPGPPSRTEAIISAKVNRWGRDRHQRGQRHSGPGLGAWLAEHFMLVGATFPELDAGCRRHRPGCRADRVVEAAIRSPTEAASIQETAQLLDDLSQIVGVLLDDTQGLL
jgi:hypothetical protein